MNARPRWAAGLVALIVVGALVAPASVPVASAARAKEPAYESTVRLTIADLQDYWGSELPALYGVEYRKIPAARIPTTPATR